MKWKVGFSVLVLVLVGLTFATVVFAGGPSFWTVRDAPLYESAATTFPALDKDDQQIVVKVGTEVAVTELSASWAMLDAPYAGMWVEGSNLSRKEPASVKVQREQETLAAKRVGDMTWGELIVLLRQLLSGQPASFAQATVTSTVTISATTPVSGTGAVVVTTLQDSKHMGTWEIEYFTGATAQMRGFVFTDPDKTWEKFPNVDWPARKFLAKNGLEYGKAIDEFCQQSETCDIVVPARSYRYITGDYNVSGIGQCSEGGTGIGCALILVNMGDVSASFEDQSVDAGFSVTGLYWNGDEVDQGISALASHLAYRMIGVPKGNPASPGGNCSNPQGCKGLNEVFAIISGNELLVRGETTVR